MSMRAVCDRRTELGKTAGRTGFQGTYGGATALPWEALW